MNARRPTYSVDTSGLIDGLERYYPEESFPALWQKIDELVAEGRFLLSEEVWEEVKSKDAVVRAWCEPRKGNLIVPTTAEVAVSVRELLAEYPRLVANMKNRNRADPFVIAVAKLRPATVVTGEGPGGSANRPKIPFICDAIGIPCVRFTDIVTTEGWTF